MGQELLFRKGGSGDSPQRTPDTLRSDDTVEVLLGISEGPILGLKNGPKSFMLDDTPLINEGSGKPNFKNFTLDTWPGNETGHEVAMHLGGFANPIQVGVPLAQDTPVVRRGLTYGIDAIDFRLVVNNLQKTNDDGTFELDLKVKLEWKGIHEAAWRPAIPAAAHIEVPDTFPPSGDPTGDHWTSDTTASAPTSATFQGSRQIVTGEGPPSVSTTVTDPNAVYEDTLTGTLYAQSHPVALFADDVVLNTLPEQTWEQILDASTITGGSFTDQQGRVHRIWPATPSLTADMRKNAVAGDMWKNTSNGQWYIYFTGSWLKSGSPTQIISGSTEDGVWSIVAKATSPTPKDIRILIPKQEYPVEVRVTKLSPDSNAKTQFRDVTFESFTEIKREARTFYGLAMARVVGQASDQFTALPTWNGIYMGRIIRVPSNYDPDTRIFSGTWDGTWKLACNNNPAFVFKDFVENDRYGLSSVYPHVVNNAQIYQWGVSCDERVPLPDGTTQPRWTYNDYLQQPRDAREMAQFIASIGAAKYVDDGAGNVEILIDANDDPVALFTPENVSEDGFKYSYSDRQTRANEIQGTFINPELNWQSDTRILRDEQDIADYGRITEPFEMVGCTNVWEADRRMRRRLIGGLTEKEFVTFTTNRQGKFLREWDVILVADPKQGRGLSGRVREVTGPRQVSLRDPVSLEAGFTYIATFTIRNPAYPAGETNPFKIVQLEVATPAGSGLSTLEFADDLPDNLPEYAAFALSADGVTGLPKPYRLLDIDDDSSTGEVITLTALELNRNKFAYIDTAVEQPDLSYTDLSNTFVDEIRGAKVDVLTERHGAVVSRILVISWVKPLNRWVRRFRVKAYVNNQPINESETYLTEFRMPYAQRGQYVFDVTAINVLGRESKPVRIFFNVSDNDEIGDLLIRALDPPENVRLVGGGTTFETLDPVFEWDPPLSPDPLFKTYRVKIIDPDTGQLVRQADVNDARSWKYNFPDQLASTILRTFTFQVCCVDQFGEESPEIELTVTNPAPATPVGVDATGLTGALLVDWDPPPELDFAGTLVQVNGLPAKDAGKAAQVTIPLAPGSYSVQVAHYDAYSQQDLNWYTVPAQVDVAASASGADLSAINAAGSNLIRLTRYQLGIKGHSITQNPGGGATLNTSSLILGGTTGDPVMILGTSTGQAGNTVFAACSLGVDTTKGKAQYIKIKGGKRYAGGGTLTGRGPGATGLRVRVKFFTKNLTPIADPTPVSSFDATVDDTEAFEIVDAPATAKFCYVEFIGLKATTTTGGCTLGIEMPFLRQIHSTATTNPSFTEGMEGEFGATIGAPQGTPLGNLQDSQYVVDRTQHFDTSGVMTNYRALARNVLTGNSYFRDNDAPMSSFSTAIVVAAHTYTLPGPETLSAPGAAINGLSANTWYHVFLDLQTMTYVAATLQNAGAYWTDISRYFYIGAMLTQLTTGGYSPPPPPPLGGGGKYTIRL
jgi:hypothetical protein